MTAKPASPSGRASKPRKSMGVGNQQERTGSKRRGQRRPLPPTIPMLGVENDCEDQGFSRISDGCLKFECQRWRNDKPTHPRLIKVTRYGKQWWTCPRCHGSYGEVRNG